MMQGKLYAMITVKSARGNSYQRSQLSEITAARGHLGSKVPDVISEVIQITSGQRADKQMV